MPAEMQGQNWALVAENALKQLVDIQSMIDIMSERLVALRDLRLQEFIKQEIRSLEGKLIKHFWKQLTTKCKVPKDQRTEVFQTYPSLSKWLTVVGINNIVNERLVAENISVEILLELSEEKLSKILCENGGDSEDQRKLRAALSQLKDFDERNGNNQQDTEGIFWDSWCKVSHQVSNGVASGTNNDQASYAKSGVDYNENIQTIESSLVNDGQNNVRKHEILVQTVSGTTTAWTEADQKLSPPHSSKSSLSSGGPPSPPAHVSQYLGSYLGASYGGTRTPPATQNTPYPLGYGQEQSKAQFTTSVSPVTAPFTRSNKMLENNTANLSGKTSANSGLLLPFGPMRGAKSYEWQVGNRIAALGDESLTNSNLSLTSITTLPPPSSSGTSGSKPLSTGKKRKKRPGNIVIQGNDKRNFSTSDPPDLIDLLRSGNRKISQSVTISPESGPSTCTSESPMSPRTPMTPATPFINDMWMHHKDLPSPVPPQTPKTPSRFKGLRAIKDKIKDKIGLRSHKLRRNKSEERVAEDELVPPTSRHKARSETFPLINTAGISNAASTNTAVGSDKMLGPRHDESRHNSTHSSTSSISESRQHFRMHHDSSSFDMGLLCSAGMTTPGWASMLSSQENFVGYNSYFESTSSLVATDKTLTAVNGPDEVDTLVEDDQDLVVEDYSTDEGGDAGDEEFNMRANLMRQGSTTSTMNEEWNIPWEELNLQEIVGQGRVGTVHRGKWHGEVAIRVIKICHNDDSILRAFKHEVKLYKKTRHENVELFMGSCINPKRLAIVTGFCKGKSLYHYIRANKEVNLNQAKIIAQHIAQGMGYLHSRGIIHKDLKTKNIFIDGKRVVVTDFGLMGLHAISSKTLRVKPKTLQIPDGWLCYMAPEVIRALGVPRDGIDVVSALPYTKESDVYAFGTVWYELLTGCWPFRDYPAESIIWQVGNGKKQSLAHLQGPKELKDILMTCWAYDTLHRPDFSDSGIMGQLLRLPQAKIIRRGLSEPSITLDDVSYRYYEKLKTLSPIITAKPAPEYHVHGRPRSYS